MKKNIYKTYEEQYDNTTAQQHSSTAVEQHFFLFNFYFYLKIIEAADD